MNWQKLMKGSIRYSLFIVFFLACLTLGIYWHLIDRMPDIEGSIEVQGPGANISLNRDVDGALTVNADDRLDASYGLGFAHAQDRYFQMDLARRQSAGELAGLLGRGLLSQDEQYRMHMFRSRAEKAYSLLPDHQQRILNAYADGVNAAIDAQQALAPEYLIAPGRQEKWKPEDSLLVIYGIYLALQEGAIERERFFVNLREVVSADLVCFLLSGQTVWDSTLDNSTLENCPIPDDLQMAGTPVAQEVAKHIPEQLANGVPGTNIWGVTADHSDSGGALLANDPHMNLFMPGVWYHTKLNYGYQDKKVELTGFSIPGIPVMGIGQSQYLAWGFSNNIGKMFDYIHVELDGNKYLTADGWQPLQSSYQVISNANGDDLNTTVYLTRWGPLMERNGNRGLALRWTAYQDDATSLGLIELETAQTVEAGLSHAGSLGLPSLNLFMVDTQGTVGWSVTGPIFDRENANQVGGRSWQEADTSWRHRLVELPQVIRTQNGKIWNANNRPLGSDFISKVGDGGFVEGVRGAILKEKLMAKNRFTREDFENWQMDNTDQLHEFWKNTILKVVDNSVVMDNPQLENLISTLQKWDGEASADSAAMRFLAAFRYETSSAFLQALVPQDSGIDMDYSFLTINNRWDTALRRVIESGDERLLPPSFNSWQDFLLSIIIDLDYYFLDSFGSYEQVTWGDRNRLEMYHPFGFFNDVFATLLNAPEAPQPGNVFTLNAHVFGYGAAVRVVFDMAGKSSFNMPGGQSGHFLSPYYNAGTEDWLRGEFKTLSPGPAKHQLTLVKNTNSRT